MRESVELVIRGVHLLAAIVLVRWCYLFYLRRDADSTTQLTAANLLAIHIVFGSWSD